jgi:hypothetical protein
MKMGDPRMHLRLAGGPAILSCQTAAGPPFEHLRRRGMGAYLESIFEAKIGAKGLPAGELGRNPDLQGGTG